MTIHDPQKLFADAASAAPHRHRALSELLAEAASGDAPTISVGEITHALSARGLAPVVLAMGILNVVTIIPGSSTIMGLPLVFLGISLVIGARTLWLPERVRNHSFERAKLRALLDRALPYVRKLERLAHPRYWPGMNGLLDRLFGLFVLVMALSISLPIPFGNTMPALAIILVSLGFIARDGLWVIAGLFVATLAVGIVIGVGGALAIAGMSVLGIGG
jgi:hypothetical protein